MAIEYERLPWCDECEAFAVPTDAGECGECGSEVVFRDAEKDRSQAGLGTLQQHPEVQRRILRIQQRGREVIEDEGVSVDA
jgi:hypothetical protein